MPRIFTSTNDPLDFCMQCFPNEARAVQEYANLGDGPDGRGNCFSHNAAHPDYESHDYECEECKKPLTGGDN